MHYKWLPIASTFFLIIAMTIQFFVSYSREKKRVVEHIDYEIRMAQKDFVFKIYDIQEAGEQMRRFLRRHLQEPDRIASETRVILKRYKDVRACYVSFRPGFYKDDDVWYCPSAYYRGDSIIQYMYGDENHDYFQSRWYQGALESDQNGYWSPPYLDEDLSEFICTHSVRVCEAENEDEEHDAEDKEVVCVIGLDFSMKWVDAMLEEIKPFEDACCVLYGTDGALMLTSDNMGNATSMNDKEMIIRSAMLSPLGMRLEIGVPKSYIWNGVKGTLLTTLFVLLLGIGIAALLIRRMVYDQRDMARVETANRLMEHELHIASDIQHGMLPSERMSGVEGERMRGLEVDAALESMREVGGDLYDFHHKGEDLYFIIGDVSGKSVPAAMFMSATVNLFRSAVSRLQSPKEIMEDMNRVLSDNNPRMMFVTAFIGRLHVPTGELLFCNAGHLPPIKVTKGNAPVPIELVPNIPMGYDGTFRFQEQGTMLAQDEHLVLYTDGITEARNEDREMLGMKRWTEILARQEGNIHCSELQEEVKAFMVNTVPTDDITLMIIRKTSATELLQLRVENRPDQWAVLKAAIHNYGLCAGMNARALKKTEVALEELVVNIIHYSKAEWIVMKVEKTASLKEESIIITLADNGVAFDPTVQGEKDIEKAVEERQIGGLGIALVKQIADELHYRRVDDINELTIIKNIG